LWFIGRDFRALFSMHQFRNFPLLCVAPATGLRKPDYSLRTRTYGAQCSRNNAKKCFPLRAHVFSTALKQLIGNDF
jgi:hypothetical protein